MLIGHGGPRELRGTPALAAVEEQRCPAAARSPSMSLSGSIISARIMIMMAAIGGEAQANHLCGCHMRKVQRSDSNVRAEPKSARHFTSLRIVPYVSGHLNNGLIMSFVGRWLPGAREVANAAGAHAAGELIIGVAGQGTRNKDRIAKNENEGHVVGQAASRLFSC